MATNPIAPLPFPTTPPMPAVARILARYDRPKLAAFIAVAIDLLDTLGGDPDLEEDDPPGQCDEDEINTMLALSYGGGPGCLISDDDCENDGREIDDGL